LPALFKDNEEFKRRRKELCEKIGSAHALIIGGPAPNDHAPFRQYNDFFYFCGVETPQAYLLIDGSTGFSKLYLPSANQQSRERNDQVISANDTSEVAKSFGLDAVGVREDLTADLQNVTTLYIHPRDGEGWKTDYRSTIDAQRQIELDIWDNRPNRGAHLATKVKEANSKIEVKDIWPMVLDMRMTKSTLEVDILRKSGYLAAKAVVEAMKATRPGVIEYEIAAAMQYQYLVNGAWDNGYSPIVAGGKNGFLPHYSDNDTALVDGEILLVDCAPDYNYYTSDICRCWPVNGKYTDAQRALYGYLTEYHLNLLGAIRAGRTCDEIEAEVVEIMRPKVKDYDFANNDHLGGTDWMLSFNNHLAHGVGLSVHDGVEHKTGELQPGLVFAVDPQIRIESEMIYMRVEDTVVVTETGIENLTAFAPHDLDEIEKLVTGAGMVQDYPATLN
jgi:Xaa-Pro aminopeptidase